MEVKPDLSSHYVNKTQDKVNKTQTIKNISRLNLDQIMIKFLGATNEDYWSLEFSRILTVQLWERIARQCS